MLASSKIAILRIVDAAHNRASEGFRVVEDFARLHREDANLARHLKQLRHELTQALTPIDSASLLQARNPASDVGTGISTSTEFRRLDWNDVVRSNFSRVLQSLRTIEEYTKYLADTFEESIPRHVEQLRYQVYALEKAVGNALESNRELADVCTYVLTDSRRDMATFERTITDLIEADVGLIQLRDKSLDDHSLVSFGKRLTELTRDVRTRWIMNDRPDLAMVTHADGVHVGQDDLSVHQARQILGPGKLIGVSTHDIRQAHAAELAGANYIGVGPVFPSTTKSFDEFVPTEFLANVVEQISIPVFAIGGIDETNIGRFSQSGVTRVALSKAILQSVDRRKIVQTIKDSLQATSPWT